MCSVFRCSLLMHFVCCPCARAVNKILGVQLTFTKMGRPGGDGLKAYYRSKIEELELNVKDKTHNLRRLEAQRNELNTQGEFAEWEKRVGTMAIWMVQLHSLSVYCLQCGCYARSCSCYRSQAPMWEKSSRCVQRSILGLSKPALPRRYHRQRMNNHNF